MQRVDRRCNLQTWTSSVGPGREVAAERVRKRPHLLVDVATIERLTTERLPTIHDPRRNACDRWVELTCSRGDVQEGLCLPPIPQIVGGCMCSAGVANKGEKQAEKRWGTCGMDCAECCICRAPPAAGTQPGI